MVIGVTALGLAATQGFGQPAQPATPVTPAKDRMEKWGGKVSIPPRSSDLSLDGGPVRVLTPSENAGQSKGTAPRPVRTLNAAEQWFQNLDKNGDGYLSYDEMPEDLRADRNRWDVDRNGLIDLNEFKSYYYYKLQQDRAATPQGQAGVYSLGASQAAPAPAVDDKRKTGVYRSDNLPKELPPWFKQLDTDHDMQIGLYEWKAGGRSIEEFMRIDRNNDGFLTVDEVLRWQAEEQKKNGKTVARGTGTDNDDFRNSIANALMDELRQRRPDAGSPYFNRPPNQGR
jgi:Ca2+-binding EF-hand superfamily protein